MRRYVGVLAAWSIDRFLSRRSVMEVLEHSQYESMFSSTALVRRRSSSICYVSVSMYRAYEYAAELLL